MTSQIVDNILCTGENGRIVTQYDIDMCIDGYLKTCQNAELIYQNKPMIFNGLLEYIYSHCIKYVLNLNSESYEYELYNDIFLNIYIKLCYTYGYIPSIGIFISHLLHKNMRYIYSIRHGVYSGGDKVNNKTLSILKIWESLCDADLFANIMQTNSIGSIFTAKVRGYSDQPNNTPLIQVNNYAKIDAAQLDRIAAADGATNVMPTE